LRRFSFHSEPGVLETKNDDVGNIAPPHSDRAGAISPFHILGRAKDKKPNLNTLASHIDIVFDAC